MLACFGYILFCFHSDHKLNQYGKLVLELVSLKSIRILLIKTITRFSNVTINTAKVTKKCDYFCTDEHAQTQHRGYLVLLVHIFISNTVKSLKLNATSIKPVEMAWITYGLCTRVYAIIQDKVVDKLSRQTVQVNTLLNQEVTSVSPSYKP